MSRTIRIAATGALVAALSACQGTVTPADPGTAPSPVGFQGERRGSTFQGLPIEFTVSPEQQVTRLTVGYRLDSCVGTETSTEILSSNTLTSPQGLVFAAQLALSKQVQVQAFSMIDGSLRGVMLFVVPQACGPSEAIAGSLVVVRK